MCDYHPTKSKLSTSKGKIFQIGRNIIPGQAHRAVYQTICAIRIITYTVPGTPANLTLFVRSFYL